MTAAILIFIAIAATLLILKELTMSDKLDALAATVSSLESAVATNSGDIAAAAQLFKDNAAASVQLAADEAQIVTLTDRVSAAVSTLSADDATFKAAQNPAPATA